jgi:hypothetical protein
MLLQPPIRQPSEVPLSTLLASYRASLTAVQSPLPVVIRQLPSFVR